MSNIKFENCTFNGCYIHAGDTNYNGGSGGVSSAMGLGVLLLGGAIAFPSLATVVPLCVVGAKTFLTGMSVYCGLQTVKTLVLGDNNKEDVKMLDEPNTDYYGGDKGYIELEPISVRDCE